MGKTLHLQLKPKNKKKRNVVLIGGLVGIVYVSFFFLSVMVAFLEEGYTIKGIFISMGGSLYDKMSPILHKPIFAPIYFSTYLIAAVFYFLGLSNDGINISNSILVEKLIFPILTFAIWYLIGSLIVKIYLRVAKISGKKALTIFIVFSLLLFLKTGLSLAATPYKGSLHQHTGYSTWSGYDGLANTTGDNCEPNLLEFASSGKTVGQLANQVGSANLSWLGFSDHSYCTNSTEFDVVKNDCESSRNSTFTCLMGEELSVSDQSGDNEPLFLLYCQNPDKGEAHIGGYGLTSFLNQSSPAMHCPISPQAQSGIDSINSQQGLSILNHPNLTFASINFLDFDSLFAMEGYRGIELFNADFNPDDTKAVADWKTILLGGNKVFAYGGTDSHNDVSTVNYDIAYLDGPLNDTNLKQALESGYVTVSNNGEMHIEVAYGGQTYHMGETLNVTNNDLVNVTVSYDLDNGCALNLLKGQPSINLESSGLNLSVFGSGSFSIQNTIIANSYFRAECSLTIGSNVYRVISNPIWVNAVNSTSSCSCTGWSAGSCSAGSCGANERQYTRTCTPSACSAETQCVPDVSCLGGSTLITVCSSGCDYTTIQSAIDNSNPGDHINVTDNRNYAEHLTIDSGDAEWLECSGGANISSNSGTGIFVVNPSTVDDIYIKGCTIKNFGTGIWLNRTTNARLENLSFINVGTSIYIDDDSDTNKIINNSIVVSQDYGIQFDTIRSSTQGPLLNQVKYNKILDSAVIGIWLDKTLNTEIIGNTINGSDDSGDYGIDFNGHNTITSGIIENNTIYSNDIGFYNQNANSNTFESNVFCPLNPTKDIWNTGTGLSGNYNTCDNPAGWNDAGSTGCKYSCDSPPSTYLIAPLDGSTLIKKDSNFTCYSEDNNQLSNITLYHNATGVWHANQTNVVTGTSNSTVFTLNNLVNGTNFMWNCMTTDNSSHSSFAASNWSVNVNLINRVPSIPNVLGCNYDYCFSNNTFFDSVNVTCFGSVDDDNDEITYFLDAFYDGSWSSIGNHTENSFLLWNISSINGQSNVGIRCRAIDLSGSNTYTDYYSPPMSLKIYNSINDTNKFLVQNSSGYTVAWIGDLGNMVLKGACSISSNCTAPSGSLIFSNATDNSTGYLDLDGNLCLESGSCSDMFGSCNPSRDSFLIQNTTAYNMSYIDFNGNLCLTGGLYQNVPL